MLTPEDAAAVLRRAAELDTPPLEELDGLSEEALREAAREVGLSGEAVDQAVEEWRRGALAPLPPLAPERWVGLPGCVVVQRAVPRPAAQVQRALDAWLRGQWFEPRRVSGGRTDWAPRRGALAAARRAADVQRRLRLRAVDRLRAEVLPGGDGCQVRLVADLGTMRTGLVTGLVAFPAAAAGAGTGLALGVVGGVAPDLLLALPAAAGVGGLGWLGARSVLRTQCGEVEEALESALVELASRGTSPTRLGGWPAATGWAGKGTAGWAGKGTAAGAWVRDRAGGRRPGSPR